MKFIVGLGNPEQSFAKTRHNIGFEYLNWFATRSQTTFSFQKKIRAEIAKCSPELLLCKPQTFMNLSGEAVSATLTYYGDGNTSSQLQNLVVVHDDLDLPLGTYKMQLGTGPKKHNGLLSLYSHLKSENFWHVRIGIENRGDFRTRIPGEQYVLQPFPIDERNMIQAIFPKIMADIANQVLLP